MRRPTEQSQRSGWRVLPLLLLAAWFALGTPVAAQELVLTVKTQTPKVRSQAPVPLNLNLNWNTTDLLEGTLYIEVREGAERIMKYENADLAMVVGDNELRIMLPPLDLDTDEIELTARFSSLEWGPFDLGKHAIKLVPDWTRQVLVGLVVPQGDRSPRKAYAFVDDFSLTRFQPQVDRKGLWADELRSADARIDAGEFPTLSANLCAFDVLLLTQGTLEDLRSGERKALRQWVDAGGSVMLDASGPIDIDETEYLNELASRKRGENAFLPAGNGKLLPGQLVMARYGLGRVVVTTTPATELSSRQTSVASQWLWKVTRSARAAIDRSGKWEPLKPGQRRRSVQTSMNYGFAGTDQTLESITTFPPYAPIPADFAPDLPSSLLPTSVRTVPLPIVVSLLSLFLVIIAPGDWYILGKLKRRMLTWVVFPGVCILFGLILIVLARTYVGSEDYRTAMRLVDWGAADRISRVSSVETLFAASSKPVKVRLGNELYSSVEVRAVRWTTSGAGGTANALGQSADEETADSATETTADADDGTVDYYRANKDNSVVMSDYGWQESDPSAEDRGGQVATIIGRPPGAYFVETEVAQWTPFVARTTGFTREAKDEFAIDWANTTFKAISSDPEAVADDLRGANPLALVCVLRGDVAVGLGENPHSLQRVARFLRMAAQSSADQSQALFQVVSRVSPNGHSSLEDLHLLDKTNPDEALVLIARADGSNVVIHRRLFHKDDTRTTE